MSITTPPPGSRRVTLDDMIVCVRREIGMRKRVYPRWVESLKMSAGEATREIEVMEAVYTHLLAEKEGLNPSLFG
jgi:hypothetical protein